MVELSLYSAPGMPRKLCEFECVVCVPLAHVPQGALALDEPLVRLLALDGQLGAVVRQALLARVTVHLDTVGSLQALGQVLAELVALPSAPRAARTTPRIVRAGRRKPRVERGGSRSRGAAGFSAVCEQTTAARRSMDAAEDVASAPGPSSDAGARRQFLRPDDAASPPPNAGAPGVTEVLVIDPGTSETPTEEQEEETRAVERNLRRWAEQERLQRKNSRSQPVRNHSVLPMHTTGLVRKLSSSFAARHRHTPSAYDNAFEMVQPSAFGQHANAPRAPTRYASVDSEEGHFVHLGEPSEQQALQADHSHYFDPDGNAGDISSVSFDDYDENKAPHDAAPPDGALAPPSAAVYDDASPLDSPTPTDDANMAATLARIRSDDFPRVTVGRASSIAARRGAAARRSPSAGVARSDTHRGHITAIPEVAHPDEVDVASGATSIATATDPFASPVRVPSEASGTATPDYAGPSAAMELGARTPEPELAEPAKRWYWSDLLLGCGLCSTADQDEEQAAYTNPME